MRDPKGEEKNMAKGMRSVSVVSDRLAWLTGQAVIVKVAAAEYLGIDQPHEFAAVYLETLPMGSAYFFRFKLSTGATRLIRTNSVVEINTVAQ